MIEKKYTFISDVKKSKLSTPNRVEKYKNPLTTSPISTTNLYITSEDKSRIAGNPLLFPPIVSPSEFNLSLALARMNSCYEQVTDLIPRIVYFDDRPSEGTTPYTNIGDGCDDMYDTANAYNTNLTQLYVDAKEDNVSFEDSIPYTHTQATEGNCDYTDPPMDGTILDGSDYFGENSEYFTNMYPGMFMIAASNVNITEYSITGDIGSDGDGIESVYIETTHPGWTAFIKTNYDGDGNDPSINHIILVYGNVSEVTQLYDDTGEYDDHCLQNLGPQNSSIITAVVATETDSPALTSEEAVAIANKILDVCLIGC